MLTVQGWLRKVPKSEIIDLYLYHFPPDYFMIENKDLTLAQINNRIKSYISDLIDDLSSRTPVAPENGEKMAFSVGYAYMEEIVQENVLFISLAELEDTSVADADVKSYSCLFVPFTEIAGTPVADTDATHKNMAYMLAYILHEISFFGNEEEMEKERQILEERTKEVENGSAQYVPAEEVFKDLEKREKYPLEDKFVHDVREKEIEFNRFLFANSIRDIRDSLGIK